MFFKIVSLLFVLFSCSKPTESSILDESSIDLVSNLDAKVFDSSIVVVDKSFSLTTEGINKEKSIVIYFDYWFNLRLFSDIKVVLDYNTESSAPESANVINQYISYSHLVSENSFSDFIEISDRVLKETYLRKNLDFRYGLKIKYSSGVISQGTVFLPLKTTYNLKTIHLLAMPK